MAIHNKKHTIHSTDDHAGGTTPSAGEFNLVGTNDAGAVSELTVESPGTASTTSRIVRRAADGHISVPGSGQESGEVLSKGQVESLIASGIWKAIPFHSDAADHTSSAVGNGTTGGPALQTDDLVVNTTDQKYYKVISVAGGTTGNLVTWDSGTSPTTAEARTNKLTDSVWMYDTDTSTWIDRGAASHNQQHAITSVADHTAGVWKTFYSDESGELTELALGAANAPLLGGGTSAAPVFGSLLLASAVVDAAGEYPADTDVATWGNNTFGILKGTGGRIFFTFKNSTDVYYVEMTGI